MTQQNLSLRQKSAARMALVQALYSAKVADEPFSPEATVTETTRKVKEGKEGDKELYDNVEPDYAFLKKLAGGIAPELRNLTDTLKEHLAADWKIERMSPLLISILQAGLFEMKRGGAMKPAVVIDEYTRIAGSFFEEDEVNFVHGILHKLAHVLREANQ